MSPARPDAPQQLRVDPIRCQAHGLCAELLPERVTLDDWGYPILDGAALDPELHALARRAVDACPVFALGLVAAPAIETRRRRTPERPGRPGRAQAATTR